jgi:hypothetical protein
MPTIDLSQDVYSDLKQLADPFEDTPDSVIRRLLDQHAGQTPPRKRARPGARAVPGTILPETEYEIPILQALDELGGRAPAGVVTDRVGELLERRLTDQDHERHRSGDVRWRNRTAFARLALVKRDELASDSPRGIWEITDIGRKRLER